MGVVAHQDKLFTRPENILPIHVTYMILRAFSAKVEQDRTSTPHATTKTRWREQERASCTPSAWLSFYLN